MGSNNHFSEEFERVLAFLNKDEQDLLSVFESITLNYLQSNPNLSHSIFVAYQVHLYELLGEYTNPILHYIKQIDPIDYKGQHKQCFRRIEKIRKISYFHFNDLEGTLSGHNKIKGSLFSYDSKHPWQISMILLRQDRKSFNLSLEINDAMNLTTQLIENMIQKLDRGNNEVDIPLYEDLNNVFSSFSQIVNDGIKESQNESE